MGKRGYTVRNKVVRLAVIVKCKSQYYVCCFPAAGKSVWGVNTDVTSAQGVNKSPLAL